MLLKELTVTGPLGWVQPPDNRAEVGGHSRELEAGGGKVEQFIIYMYKECEELGTRHSWEDGSSSVGDDELVHPPVFVAPVWQVAPNDDGDLSGPVAREKSQVHEGWGPKLYAGGTDCVQDARTEKS